MIGQLHADKCDYISRNLQTTQLLPEIYNVTIIGFTKLSMILTDTLINYFCISRKPHPNPQQPQTALTFKLLLTKISYTLAPISLKLSNNS